MVVVVMIGRRWWRLAMVVVVVIVRHVLDDDFALHGLGGLCGLNDGGTAASEGEHCGAESEDCDGQPGSGHWNVLPGGRGAPVG